MPTYKTPRHAVSLSEALHEAATVATLTKVILSTFELYHPIGTPGGPIYVVNNYEPLTATKEADAVRDPAGVVEFLACAVSIGRPEEDDSARAQELTLTVSNVSGVMNEAIRSARGSLDPWEIVERVYSSDDSSGPAILPPLSLLVVGVEISPEVVTLRCSFGDPANTSVPSQTFQRRYYPALVR